MLRKKNLLKNVIATEFQLKFSFWFFNPIDVKCFQTKIYMFNEMEEIKKNTFRLNSFQSYDKRHPHEMIVCEKTPYLNLKIVI
jgi:hypothetical protein